jgi:hypothetical protein
VIFGRSGISTVDLNERLAALENRMERYEDEIHHALTDHQIAEAREELLAHQRRRRPRAHSRADDRERVSADLESLRAGSQQFRTSTGSKIGVALGSR